ncbi:MAG: hypothetical protein ACI9R8_000654 [Candidatus Paceibacteria bacterium]|jgi:hypothetical protein
MLTTKLITKIFTRHFKKTFTISRHHLALLVFLAAPTAILAETSQTVRVIQSDSQIQQRSNYSAADYNHCHFDEAHGHTHCYTDQQGHACDQVIIQQPNIITHTTRRYNAPTTVIENRYYNDVVTPSSIVFAYGDTHRYRSNQYYNQRPGLVFRYNNNRRHERRHARRQAERRYKNRDNDHNKRNNRNDRNNHRDARRNNH